MAAEKQSAAEDRWILPTSTLQALLYRLSSTETTLQTILYRNDSTDFPLQERLYWLYSTGTTLQTLRDRLNSIKSIKRRLSRIDHLWHQSAHDMQQISSVESNPYASRPPAFITSWIHIVWVHCYCVLFFLNPHLLILLSSSSTESSSFCIHIVWVLYYWALFFLILLSPLLLSSTIELLSPLLSVYTSYESSTTEPSSF